MKMQAQQVGENTWRLWSMNENGKWELIMTSWGKDAEKATMQWIEDYKKGENQS